MGWKATGQPTVRKQRDKWVVRVDGIDTETGKHRPRQLGTYASQRSALAAARSVSVQERVASRDTVSWLVRRYVAVAIGRDVEGAGAVRVGDPTHRGRTRRDPPRPTRPGRRRRLARGAGRGRWAVVALDPDLPDGPPGGAWLTRSRKDCCGGAQRRACRCRDRSPSRRGEGGRRLEQRRRSLGSWRRSPATGGPIAFRLGVLYGLRRSEALALRWDDVDRPADAAHRRRARRREQGRRVDRGEERTLAARDPARRRDDAERWPGGDGSRPRNGSRPAAPGRTTT